MPELLLRGYLHPNTPVKADRLRMHSYYKVTALYQEKRPNVEDEGGDGAGQAYHSSAEEYCHSPP
jgi:hypothetical protein